MVPCGWSGSEPGHPGWHVIVVGAGGRPVVVVRWSKVVRGCHLATEAAEVRWVVAPVLCDYNPRVASEVLLQVGVLLLLCIGLQVEHRRVHICPGRRVTLFPESVNKCLDAVPVGHVAAVITPNTAAAQRTP